MDVVELSDQELRQKLLDLGYQPGPIIESTRRVYELKYLKMIGELGSSDSDRECDVTVPSPTSPVKLPTGSPGHTPRPRPVSRAPIKPTTQVSEAKSNAQWKVRIAAVLAVIIAIWVYRAFVV